MNFRGFARYYDTQQVWPHFGNTAKYAVGSMVVIIGVLHPLYGTEYSENSHDWNLHRYVWLSSCIVSAVFTFWWYAP